MFLRFPVLKNVNVWLNYGSDLDHADGVLTGPYANDTAVNPNQWYMVDYRDEFIIMVVPKLGQSYTEETTEFQFDYYMHGIVFTESELWRKKYFDGEDNELNRYFLLAAAGLLSLVAWTCCACGLYKLCWEDYLGRKPVYEPGKFDDAPVEEYALKEIYEKEDKEKENEEPKEDAGAQDETAIMGTITPGMTPAGQSNKEAAGLGPDIMHAVVDEKAEEDGSFSEK